MRVSLSSSFRVGNDVEASLDVQAETIAQMMEYLAEKFPNLRDVLQTDVAVSIDGQIFRDDWTQTIPSGAEVYLIPRIEGG
ncbi:MAG: molybdopterin synthase sulfur carrier subunit [Candidatus Azotimanducaceae bacterium]|jgi:molybdopterin synthase sulfur carrier subunit|tara:strand:+ start:916 stop:1158 length:243 start_codon:yes stop_codon:yes gene_type:complete